MCNTFFYLHLSNKTKVKMTIQELNQPREDGFPKILEISLSKEIIKLDAKDPNYDKPISALTKEYDNQTGILIFKVK